MASPVLSVFCCLEATVLNREVQATCQVMMLDCTVSLLLGSVWLMMIQTFPGASAALASSRMPFDSKASERLKWMENPPGDQMGCLLFVFVKQCLGT